MPGCRGCSVCGCGWSALQGTLTSPGTPILPHSSQRYSMVPERDLRAVSGPLSRPFSAAHSGFPSPPAADSPGTTMMQVWLCAGHRPWHGDRPASLKWGWAFCARCLRCVKSASGTLASRMIFSASQASEPGLHGVLGRAETRAAAGGVCYAHSTQVSVLEATASHLTLLSPFLRRCSAIGLVLSSRGLTIDGQRPHAADPFSLALGAVIWD